MSIEEQIRREYETGATYRQLAKKYRKNFSQIADIVNPERKAKADKRLAALEDRLSKLEGIVDELQNFKRVLRGLLDILYEAHISPEMGCFWIEKSKSSKFCLYEKPSRICCALCPYYMPKWLLSAIRKEMGKPAY